MSILSTNHRLISIGESYSAGNGIDITDQVISVTGDATPYSAGENIDIQDHIISGKDWSQDITDASSNAYNETTAWVQENYANSADMTYISAVVDTKLDASAWSTVSADYATEDYVIMADNITYNRATGYVDSQQFAKESACQSAFDYFNTNKLNTEDFTAWQNGQYATDLQTIEGQINDKLNTSSFSEVSGSFLTAINIPESATWQDVSETVQTNSATWGQGGIGDEEVNDFVYNNSGDIIDVNNVVQSNSANWDSPDLSEYIKFGKTDISDNYVSATFEVTSGWRVGRPKLVYSAHSENGFNSHFIWKDGSELLLSANESNSQNRYVNIGEDGIEFSSNIPEASGKYGAEESEYLHSISSTISDISGDISNKLDTTAFSTVSGDFLTAAPSDMATTGDVAELAQTVSETYQVKGDYAERDFVLSSIESATSGKLDVSSFASVSSDFLTTSFGISESGTWNDVSETVQTNSAQWAEGGGSTSGFVSGSNVLFVPNEDIPGLGKVYSANISGDITVNLGDYFNSGEIIDIYATYSLSSLGSQIGDKLNKSVIEDSKTLSIIDGKAEVYSLAYRPSELVTTGITVENNSSPDYVNINIKTEYPYKLYSASLVIESDGFNEDYIPGGWNFVNSANGSATFSRFYKDRDSDTITFLGFWDYNLTNDSAYAVACSPEIVIDELAFKSDLTGQGGGVPQSAFDELKSSYDALSASYVTLSSLFATYSGQWLLPNEGV